MSASIDGFVDASYMAAADLSTKRWCFVRLSADNTVTTPGAAATDIIGVQQNMPSAAGQPTLVRPCPDGGTTEILAGAAFAAGAPLTSDASGRAVTATTTQRFYARAVYAATALGDVVEAMLATGTVP